MVTFVIQQGPLPEPEKPEPVNPITEIRGVTIRGSVIPTPALLEAAMQPVPMPTPRPVPPVPQWMKDFAALEELKKENNDALADVLRGEVK